jgi:Protein of unknown function (DUF2795)
MAKVDTTQLENALRGLKYPIARDELIEHVEDQGLDEQLCMAVRQLPNQHFRSAGEVSKAIGLVGDKTRAK